MRRFAVLFALVAVLAVPALAAAGTVTLTDYANTGPFGTNAGVSQSGYAGYGGPFLATTGGGGPLGNTSFLTFCLEINEDFSYGGSYHYTLDTYAINGGLGGQDPAGSNQDPLSVQTRWLYYEIITNGYSSPSWAGPSLSGLGENVGAAFQYAFWNLEGELTDVQTQSYGAAGLAGYNLAAYALGLAPASLSTPGYSIYAMNLTNGTARNQSQLAFQAVPEPATLSLLGLGLLGLGLRARKLRARQ